MCRRLLSAISAQCSANNGYKSVGVVRGGGGERGGKDDVPRAAGVGTPSEYSGQRPQAPILGDLSMSFGLNSTKYQQLFRLENCLGRAIDRLRSD